MAIMLTAVCSCCGEKEDFNLTEEETKVFERYQHEGRNMGYLQDLFPRVPAWIRSGAIDQYSGGFCICPKCGQ